ncbi:anti-sigma factor family protein [Pseudonocardia endophytica]|uniref:Putative zinc finger protein n=1 Tax=Pseudonocardia endophytica TaxID=401976 RepID=A0A4V2PIT3_PSEEN|nr:zf-HC2 domain-containing protein [Pseudonocardia endophytica]TCK25906.1 putative zinc finger protein [Pseudonocardia endophytica]
MTPPIEPAHDPEELTAHAMGLLDGPEAAAVEQHLRGCAACRREWTEIRETVDLVGSLPPEMFADGPPSSDLPLRRALREVRDEPVRHRMPRRRPVGRLLAVAAAALVLVVGGGLVGRLTAPEPSATSVAAGPGAITAFGQQGTVRMTASVAPAAGWVRVATEVQGITPGKRCTLEIENADGKVEPAAFWMSAPPREPGRPTPVAGSAIIDPASVRAVSVRDDTGATLVRVPLSLT